jgi:hypothetical protein
MKDFTTADLEMLAHGQPVAPEVFRSIFADDDAVTELSRLLQVRDLVAPPPPELVEPMNLPEMDVTFDDLTRYTEGQSLDAQCRQAVERFLHKHFPDSVDPGADTHIEFRASDDTEIRLPPCSDTAAHE